ncbi:hypothetical protein Tco_1402289, partial [Tanacetum coccineum]
MAHLPADDQRHLWLRYQVEEYTEGMRHDLAVRLRMVYTREGRQVFVSHAWKRLFGFRAPLVGKFILEFLSTCRMSDTKMGLDVVDILCFQLGGDASEELIPQQGDLRDYRLRSRLTEHSWAPPSSYVFFFETLHAEGRKSGASLSRGHFIGRLAMHFGLVNDEGLRGLQRQLATTVGADEAGSAVDEDAQEIPAPAQAPPPLPPAPQPQTMSQMIERIEEESVIYDMMLSACEELSRALLPSSLESPPG